jgi:prepilin signal peptidase PulO-like enzyme (type II secretory pathway)
MTLMLHGVIGALLGMVINYFADVLPASRRITRPLCPQCHQPYPIKDYLVGLKCSSCGHQTSPRFIIVLLGAIIASILLNYFPLSTLGYWGSLPILIFLGVIVVIDIEHRLVLIEITLLGLGLCFVYGILLHGFLTTIAGAAGGLLIMLMFYLSGIGFSKILGRLRGKKMTEVAFGFGDVFAGTFLGLLTGWPLIAGAIIIALLSFSAFSILFLFGLLLSKRYRAFANALPFTPFLILGAITMFYL